MSWGSPSTRFNYIADTLCEKWKQTLSPTWSEWRTSSAIITVGTHTYHSRTLDLLKTARAVSARSINAVMTAPYWEIGRRIVESEMRGEKCADYGARLVEWLAVDLTEQSGRGFGKISLWRIRTYFQAWPEKQILSTPLKESGASTSLSEICPFLLSSVPSLSALGPLPWSAYLRLLAVRSPEAKKFY